MSVLNCLEDLAIAPLPNHAQIQLTGSDAFSFMHRLSTQNCQTPQSGQGCLNALLTPKGRFVGLLHQVVLPNNSALLLGGQGQQQQIEQWLNKHLFIENVQFCSVNKQNIIWWVAGKKAASKLTRLLGQSPPAEPWQCLLHNNDYIFRTFNCVDSHGQPVPAWLLRIRHTRGNSLIDALTSQANPHVLSADEAEAIRIAAGIPRYDNEINDQTNPLQLGLQAAIDINKGCYVGQEVMSRLITYKKVKDRLVKIMCHEQAYQQLRVGQRLLLHNQQAGQITSVSPLFTPGVAVALALVKLPVDTTLPSDALVVQSNQTDSVSVRLHTSS